jgi:hypothetical protein
VCDVNNANHTFMLSANSVCSPLITGYSGLSTSSPNFRNVGGTVWRGPYSFVIRLQGSNHSPNSGYNGYNLSAIAGAKILGVPGMGRLYSMGTSCCGPRGGSTPYNPLTDGPRETAFQWDPGVVVR